MEPIARDIAAKFFAPDDPKYDALVREIVEAFENALDDYRLNRDVYPPEWPEVLT